MQGSARGMSRECPASNSTNPKATIRLRPWTWAAAVLPIAATSFQTACRLATVTRGTGFVILTDVIIASVRPTTIARAPMLLEPRIGFSNIRGNRVAGRQVPREVFSDLAKQALGSLPRAMV
jgi:hypothetical protein